jgi:lipoprotein-anchoring transpeptidase ErfK/SrfK
MVNDMKIIVSICNQTLQLTANGSVLRSYAVSTAKNGAGEQKGSGCTPRGLHVVRAKIGGGSALGTVFVGRRPTGEIFSAELAAANPQRDWILTRILWLCGREHGKNRFGDVDTMRRYIYIHGCPDDLPMGVPASHGCVRMRNQDVAELFDMVDAGTEVLVID